MLCVWDNHTLFNHLIQFRFSGPSQWYGHLPRSGEREWYSVVLEKDGYGVNVHLFEDFAHIENISKLRHDMVFDNLAIAVFYAACEVSQIKQCLFGQVGRDEQWDILYVTHSNRSFGRIPRNLIGKGRVEEM